MDHLNDNSTVTQLPTSVYSASTVRALERAAMAYALPGATLMARAAAGAFRVLRAEWPTVQRVLVLCGPGNNGGDGVELALLARAAGFVVVVCAPCGLPVSGEARAAWARWSAQGGMLTAWSPALLDQTELVVDALLGIGLARPIEGDLRALIESLNARSQATLAARALPVLSLDIPSGLDADTGEVLGVAVNATATVSFLALKSGLFLGAAIDRVGTIWADGLRVPDTLLSACTPVLRRVVSADRDALLPARARSSHKGRQGRVLIIGGSAGMAGAALLAGLSALRAGAGRVVVATIPAHAVAMTMAQPELMVMGVEQVADLLPALEAADVVAIGPGLGQSAWARALLSACCASAKPLVVDADALNLLALQPMTRAHWCLTPHPAEAARLLSISTEAVQADRLSAVRHLQERYGGVAVLKGAGTLIASEGDIPQVCDRGNPGMAIAGMGDVLTGIIAGIVAQQNEPIKCLASAAAVGVWVHATAGDRAAQSYQRGLLASEVIAQIPFSVNGTC